VTGSIFDLHPQINRFTIANVSLLVGARIKVSDQFGYCSGGACEVMLAFEVMDIIKCWDETYDINGRIFRFCFLF